MTGRYYASDETEEWTDERLLDELEQIHGERTGNNDWAFDPEQREAIQQGTGSFSSTAGAGCGKSEIMVARALRLAVVEGVDPRRIMLTAFTEKAAENLQNRLKARLNELEIEDEADIADMWVGTLHQLGNDIN